MPNAPAPVPDMTYRSLSDEHSHSREGPLAALLVLTVLLIAHRLVTVRHADRIYVLAEGRVSESGPYAELISANGTFAHLARSAVGRS